MSKDNSNHQNFLSKSYSSYLDKNLSDNVRSSNLNNSEKSSKLSSLLKRKRSEFVEKRKEKKKINDKDESYIIENISSDEDNDSNKKICSFEFLNKCQLSNNLNKSIQKKLNSSTNSSSKKHAKNLNHRFQSTPKPFYEEFKIDNNLTPAKCNSQNISPVDSPKCSKIKISSQVIARKLFDSLKDSSFKIISPNNSIVKDFKKNECSFPSNSQSISQVDSPIKQEKISTNESIFYLNLSKKMKKLLMAFNENNFNRIKGFKENSLTHQLLKSINNLSELRKEWFNSNNFDSKNNFSMSSERSELFLKLKKVNKCKNGLVVCDVQIDSNLNEEIFYFKNKYLKTIFLYNHSLELKISEKAVISFVNPWYTFECDEINTTVIINPFWIKILDHGDFENSSDDQYEELYVNENS